MIALWWTVAVAADIRGMTVSCPTWGWEWGSDAMVTTLDVLDTDGVNWVSIHPYARIGADGTVSAGDLDPEDPPAYLVRPIREAHARGMKVMIKPHLAYWGSPFGWRGEIAFEDPADLDRFFTSYRAWIVAMARIVADADALSIGTELGGVSHHEGRWREVIGAVDAVYSGPTTYAANWDEVGRVAFWDALDVIGVQAYFPVIPGAEPGSIPTDAELDAGWDRILGELATLSEAKGKHVVFTEMGYDQSASALQTPWLSGGGPNGASLQQVATRAVLRAIDRSPVVIGGFLWKWFPGEVQRGDFRMSTPEMRALIRTHWHP